MDFDPDEEALLDFFDGDYDLVHEFLELLPYSIIPGYHDAHRVLKWLFSKGYLR